MAASLTQKRLRELLSYNPRTGVFTWRVKPARRVGAGTIAGTRNGRLRISIDDVEYNGARLAVLWMTGKLPANVVDHINGDPNDNRWRNLRLATQSQNHGNSHMRRDNRSGLKGAFKQSRANTYYSKIKVDGRIIYLGSFETAAEAHIAYRKAARKYFGEFARFS